MKRETEGWGAIAALIDADKERALGEFHRGEFAPAAASVRIPPRRTLAAPARLAVAAGLLLVAGLVSLWLLRGGWKRSALAQDVSEILAGSFLYQEAGRPEPAGPATGPALPAGPGFMAWAESGLKRAAAEMEERRAAVDPSAPVERGDPAEVRQRIGRMIRDDRLESLLARFRKMYDKEA